MSAAKQKGTDAENKVEKFLRSNGIMARRNALHGTKDIGDIHTPGVVVSVKDVSQHHIGAWLRDAEEQAANEGDGHSFIVVVKERRGPKQSGSVEDWWVITRLREYVKRDR